MMQYLYTSSFGPAKIVIRVYERKMRIFGKFV